MDQDLISQLLKLVRSTEKNVFQLGRVLKVKPSSNHLGSEGITPLAVVGAPGWISVPAARALCSCAAPKGAAQEEPARAGVSKPQPGPPGAERGYQDLERDLSAGTGVTVILREG